jgi:hypothetical protein
MTTDIASLVIAELEGQRWPLRGLWSVVETPGGVYVARTAWTCQRGTWCPHASLFAMTHVDVRDRRGFALRALIAASVLHQLTTAN